MPPNCEICGAQDGVAVCWFDATQSPLANTAWSTLIDDNNNPPKSTFQVCLACRDRFQSGQWTLSYTPWTIVVTSATGGQSSVVH